VSGVGTAGSDQQQNQLTAGAGVSGSDERYNKNVFIAANIIGILIFIIGFFIVLYTTIADQGAPIGICLPDCGAFSNGYGRGWGSIDDQLKFL